MPEETFEETFQETFEGGSCTSSCEGWPYTQCETELRWTDGSWQTATCLNPYIASNNMFGSSFASSPPKYSNYPE